MIIDDHYIVGTFVLLCVVKLSSTRFLLRCWNINFSLFTSFQYFSNKQVDRIPFFASPFPRVATWGQKGKERVGVSLAFGIAGPQWEARITAISSVVERAPDNCDVVPGLWGLLATWIVLLSKGPLDSKVCCYGKRAFQFVCMNTSGCDVDMKAVAEWRHGRENCYDVQMLHSRVWCRLFSATYFSWTRELSAGYLCISISASLVEWSSLV